MGLGWVRMGLGSGWEGRGGMELGVCGEGALVWLGGLVQRDQAVVAGMGLGPGRDGAWTWLGWGLDLAGPEGENGASVPARGYGKCWGSGWCQGPFG